MAGSALTFCGLGNIVGPRLSVGTPPTGPQAAARSSVFAHAVSVAADEHAKTDAEHRSYA